MDGSFPPEEYRLRTARLQKAMAAEDMDALLLTTPADVLYVTGFLTRFWQSPTRPWFIIVPARGDPVAVIPAIGADLMSRTWITNVFTWPAPDPLDDGTGRLAATLADHVPESGKIGLPMGPETHLRMPLSQYAALVSALAPRRLADATGVVQSTREIKSEAEISAIRETCELAGRAFDRVPEIARAGVPLSRVFRDFQILLLEEGADWVSYLAGGAGPGGYGDVISPADERPLAQGDVLMLDTGAVRQGYFCDYDRNFAIGPAPEAARRAHAALHAATGTALETARPGMTASELHRVLVHALRREGATPCEGRMGHGLGLDLTEWPSIDARDHRILREGMVMTLEPAVEVGPGRILVHEENIVLRAEGPELLARRTPPELPEIPAR